MNQEIKDLEYFKKEAAKSANLLNWSDVKFGVMNGIISVAQYEELNSTASEAYAAQFKAECGTCKDCAYWDSMWKTKEDAAECSLPEYAEHIKKDDQFVPIDTMDDKYVVVKQDEYEAVANFMRNQLGVSMSFILGQQMKANKIEQQG